MPKSISRLVFFAVLALAFAQDALAYFDPASGSLVLQMILGGIAGVALMVRIYWHKLLGLFGVQTADTTDDEEEGDDVEDDGEDVDEDESSERS